MHRIKSFDNAYFPVSILLHHRAPFLLMLMTLIGDWFLADKIYGYVVHELVATIL